MIKKLEHLLAFGTGISFERKLNMFEIKVWKTRNNGTKKTERVHLPFDHLNEDKIINYIQLMEDKLNGNGNT